MCGKDAAAAAAASSISQRNTIDEERQLFKTVMMQKQFSGDGRLSTSRQLMEFSGDISAILLRFQKYFTDEFSEYFYADKRQEFLEPKTFLEFGVPHLPIYGS